MYIEPKIAQETFKNPQFVMVDPVEGFRFQVSRSVLNYKSQTAALFARPRQK